MQISAYFIFNSVLVKIELHHFLSYTLSSLSKLLSLNALSRAPPLKLIAISTLIIIVIYIHIHVSEYTNSILNLFFIVVYMCFQDLLCCIGQPIWGVICERGYFSSKLSLVLYGWDPLENFPFHINMSSDVVIAVISKRYCSTTDFIGVRHLHSFCTFFLMFCKP